MTRGLGTLTGGVFAITAGAFGMCAYALKSVKQAHVQADQHQRDLVKLLGDAVAATARAIGDAVSTAQVGPSLPPPTPADLASRYLADSDLVDNLAFTADDVDPTDGSIGLARERGETVLIDPFDVSPTGVPGLVFSPPTEGQP